MNCTAPPGSGTDPDTAALDTSTAGAVPPKDTRASSAAAAGFPSSSTTVAVTVSTWAGSPASPATKASKVAGEHGPHGDRRRLRRAGIRRHCRVHRVQQVPEHVVREGGQSHRLGRVAAHPDGEGDVAPGSATEPADGVLATVIDGSASPNATRRRRKPRPGCPRRRWRPRASPCCDGPGLRHRRSGRRRRNTRVCPPSGIVAACAGQVLFGHRRVAGEAQIAESVIRQGDQGDRLHRQVADDHTERHRPPRLVHRTRSTASWTPQSPAGCR